MLTHAVRCGLVPAVIALSAAACAGSEAAGPAASTSTPPVVPTPPVAPALALSTDSVVVSLIAGADRITQEIEITAGTSAAVSGLTVSEPIFASGQTTGWITATIASQTAPAKLSVSINPGALVAGKYEAQLRISAAGAESKTIRASLVVRPRPKLVLDRAALSISADSAVAPPSQTINVSSVDGTIGGLSIGTASCDKPAAVGAIKASLSSQTTPAIISITTSTSGLAVGSYVCSVNVSTTQTFVDSATQLIRVSLTVRGVPKIAFSVDGLRFQAFRLSDPARAEVVITNGGSGALTGLKIASIEYGDTVTNWLSAALDSTTAPAKLTLSARALQVSGVYTATVIVASGSTESPGSTKTLTITYAVSPRPPSLVVTPNSFSITVSRSSGAGPLTVLATAAVTAGGGDSQLSNMGFASPIGSFPPGIGVSLGCTSAYPQFTTPCTMNVVLYDSASNLLLGTYSFTAVVWSGAGQTAGVSITVRIVP